MGGENETKLEEMLIEEANCSEANSRFPHITEKLLQILATEAINRAMKEIRSPVIKRVIPITLITTRMLVVKDFALDPDPEKFKEAAMYTSQSLAGMLSQITCKEPLKHQFARCLRDVLVK